MFLENFPQSLPLFCTYLSDLRLTHSSRAPYFADVCMSSAGRQHTHMTSSMYDACSLDLVCVEPNGPLSNHFRDTEKGCSCVHMKIYPSATSVKCLANWSLTTHQISVQSLPLFLMDGKGHICTGTHANKPHP